MSLFKRGGADTAQIIVSAADPAATDEASQVYAKEVEGVLRPFFLEDDEVLDLLEPGGPTIWDPPSVAHAYDDEFESSTLDASWTTSSAFVTGIDPYAAFAAGSTRVEIHTRRPSWIMFQPPGNATTSYIQKSITLATDCFVWCRGGFSQRNAVSPVANDFNVTMILSTAVPDANNSLNFSINISATGITRAQFQRVAAGVGTTVASTVDKYVASADIQEIEAIGLQKLGTTYHAWAFGPHMALYLGNTTFASTIGTILLGATNASTVAPGNMIMGYDFVRFVNSAVFLP